MQATKQTATGEESHVPAVEHAALVVVEQSEDGACACVPVAKVRDRRDQHAARCEHLADVAEQLLRLAHVLEDVSTEHHVERPGRSRLIRDALVKVSFDEVVHAILHAIDFDHVDRRDLVPEGADALGQQPA